MIKLEHVVLPSPEQMEFVIEGLRNPMNSWDKTDSAVGCYITKDDNVVPGCNIGDFTECDKCGWCEPLCYGNPSKMSFKVGPNDLKLMNNLAKSGTDHRKFMRMMPVMLRITAPLYWWKEFDTYKVGTVANSCSTMHKITAKEFTIEDFSFEKLFVDSLEVLEDVINWMNKARLYYLEMERKLKEDTLTEDERKEIIINKKKYWWQLIQLLPSSYNQTRNVMLNYEVLENIYYSRRGHRLDEWCEFCKWIETLPYSELITGEVKLKTTFDKELAKDILLGDGRLTSSVKEEYANKIVDAVYGNATNEELKALIDESREAMDNSRK